MISENVITRAILDTSFTVHSDLGPGLLESVYERILEAELIDKGFDVRRQVPIPIKYKNLEFDEAFRADLIVENKVLVELKASETNHPVYYRQLFSYLKLTSMRFGLLMNFGSEHLKDGIKRVANGYGPSPHIS
jgi:GxxExxY protein